MQGVRQRQEPNPGQHRDHGVQPAGGRDECQRGTHRQPGVDDDLGGHLTFGGHHGKHRDARGGVVVLVLHGQRPGVRRCPEEDDREHGDCLPADRAGDRRPADHHRHTSGRATPHDVLRGAALEHQRVNENVERDGRCGQVGREHIGGPPQPEERSDRQRQTEHQGVAARHRRASQRATLGALHHLVDIGVGHTVQRVGAAGGQHPADQGVEDQDQVRRTTGGQQHGRDGGDEQQFDDPGLGQREIAQQAGAEPVGPAVQVSLNEMALGDIHPVNSSRMPAGHPDCLLQKMVDRGAVDLVLRGRLPAIG